MEIDSARKNFRWGQIETDSESESESEEEESEDEEDEAATKKGSDDEEADASGMQSKLPDGMQTPGGGMATPAGGRESTTSNRTSVPGTETPDAIQLRKKREIEAQMEQRGHQDLYKIIPERRSGVGRASAMGSSHMYDLSQAKRKDQGVELALTADELAMDQDSIRKRMEQRMQAKQSEAAPEDMSDMVREHLGHTERKRARNAARNDDQGQNQGNKKQRKDFKF